MFIVSWFYSVLNFLGLYNKSGKILFLGLDNAGKTTLLSKLKNEKLGQYEPTRHPNRETITVGQICFTTIDLGGHEIARQLWKEYFTEDISGIVFLVDAADRKRFKEARNELDRILRDKNLGSCPVLVLGNKIDKVEAVSPPDFIESMGLKGSLTGKENSNKNMEYRPLEVFMCSILNQVGYAEGFRWLSKFMD